MWCALKVSQTQTELGNDWYLDRVEVTGPEGVCWAFPCDDWFGRTEDDESIGQRFPHRCRAVADARKGCAYLRRGAGLPAHVQGVTCLSVAHAAAARQRARTVMRLPKESAAVVLMQGLLGTCLPEKCGADWQHRRLLYKLALDWHCNFARVIVQTAFMKLR